MAWIYTTGGRDFGGGRIKGKGSEVKEEGFGGEREWVITTWKAD